MRGRTSALLLVACLLAAACGEDDGGATTDEHVSDTDDVVAPPEASETTKDSPGAADSDPEELASVDGGTVEGAPEPLDVEVAPFLPTVCPFEIEVDLHVECGVVEVPESRVDLSTSTIELAVAILRTPAPDPSPDPVVFLAGGPGGVALAEHFVWLSGADDWDAHPVFATRDMILVDQRGTGYSRPSLWCDDENEGPAECHDRLVDAGIVLEAYSTLENAADIATVRLSLGIDEWNLYGSSYGTRLALTVLRDHPEGVRSLLLEGVYPPDVVPAYHDYLPNTLRALDELAAACEADDRCASTYGDVGDLLVRALAAADADPGAPIDPTDLMDLTFGNLYSMEGVLDVPYALALAADGDLDGAIDVFEAGAPLGRTTVGPYGRNSHGRWAVDPTEDSAGLFNTVECREEHAFTDLDHVGRQAEMYIAAGVDERLITALVDAVEYPVLAVCSVWESGTASVAERAPAVSDAPVLLLSGRFDPITPPAWGDIAAASLPNSTHVVAPTLSHSLLLEDPCVDEIAFAFLDDPSARVDTRCIATMPMPPFTTD